MATDEVDVKDSIISEQSNKPTALPVTAIPMVLGSPLSRSPSLLTLGSSSTISEELAAVGEEEEESSDEILVEDEFLHELNVKASEESVPEMVHIYRRKLSYVVNRKKIRDLIHTSVHIRTDLRSRLKDDFDRILMVKNKRLWRLSHHLTQSLKTITDYYRSQLDVKEYQLFLYRTKLKVMIKHMFDMAEKQDNKVARDYFNHYLNELLQAPPDNTIQPPEKIPSMFENLPGKTSTPLAPPSDAPGRGFFKTLKKIFFCSSS